MMSGEDFARLFEAQYADFDADLALWLALAEERKGPILELGCGSGRVLIALAEHGFEVVGIDNEPAMLSRGQRRVGPDIAPRLWLKLADLRDFSLDHQFPLVIIPCNTFSYLNDQEALKALAAVRRHLMEYGLLAVDLPNRDEILIDRLDPYEPVESFIEPESGHPVQVFADQEIDSKGDWVRVTWHYDELLPNGKVRRLDIINTYNLRQPERMRTLLKSAGFSSICFYGGYGREPFTPESDRMIVLSSRK